MENSKKRISPGVAIFAVIGLISAMASVLSRPSGNFDGNTTRIGAPKASVAVGSKRIKSSEKDTGSPVTVVGIQRIPIEELVGTVVSGGVFDILAHSTAPVGIESVPDDAPSPDPSGIQEDPVPLPAVEEVRVPELLLKGIVVMDDSPVALIRDPSGNEDYYGSGDTVAGCRITGVGDSWIRLRYQGKDFKVLLNGDFSPTPLRGNG